MVKNVPDFNLVATGKSLLNLKEDFKGKTLVLYFYPKDSTPGCTQEGHDFTRLHSQFKKAGAEIIGVSRDSLASHEKFKNKQKYSFELISDESEKLCKAFKVLSQKSLFGKKYIGLERSTFVISPEGIVLKEWRKVKVKNHAQEVLDFINSSHQKT